MVITKKGDNNSIHVYVALSGGVDSATAALLLQRSGYKITGVYMKTWSPPGQPCPWKEDKRDAMRICAKLGIPFKIWDFTASYKEHIVDYMVREYEAGLTPNPDVLCNKLIKFGLFFDKAISEGADYVATGHHARIKKNKKVFQLCKGADPNKDQSYFLWTLTQRELSRTLMPVGEYTEKEKVRQLAREAGLSVAEKKDSQGVCFIGPINMQEFLTGRVQAQTGPIRSVAGRELGTHNGLPFYTIGQREGVRVGGGGPYYVARKEVTTNTLVVVPPSQEKELMSCALVARDINIINTEPTPGARITAAVRYRQKPLPATWCGDGKIIFDSPMRAVTKGQSVVLYEKDRVIGGGIIEQAHPA